MKCPDCGSEDAYIGFSDIDCPNENCRHYQGNPVASNGGFIYAGPLGAAGRGSGVLAQPKVSVNILSTTVKKSSILISFQADGDPGNPTRIVEFLWYIKGSPQNKQLCTLSNRARYFVAGIDADGQTIYKTHWRCTYDGVQPQDAWVIEAQIS